MTRPFDMSSSWPAMFKRAHEIGFAVGDRLDEHSRPGRIFIEECVEFKKLWPLLTRDEQDSLQSIADKAARDQWFYKNADKLP